MGSCMPAESRCSQAREEGRGKKLGHWKWTQELAWPRRRLRQRPRAGSGRRQCPLHGAPDPEAREMHARWVLLERAWDSLWLEQGPAGPVWQDRGVEDPGREAGAHVGRRPLGPQAQVLGSV